LLRLICTSNGDQLGMVQGKGVSVSEELAGRPEMVHLS